MHSEWKVFLVACSLLVFLGASLAQAQIVPPDILDGILMAGQWSPAATENLKLKEQLPVSLIQKMASGDTNSVGLLALTTGIGKWGAAISKDGPVDPANDKWNGPRAGTKHDPGGAGKHLMSSTIGGVGLPHADRGFLADIIKEINDQNYAPSTPLEVEHMRGIEDLLRTGAAFDQFRHDPTFQRTINAGLRRKELQNWIISQWLQRYWIPSYSAVTKAGGSLEEALINVRIWNTSPSLGKCAIESARGANDPIQAELNAYTFKCKGAQSRYKADRWGWMRRPAVLYRAFHR